MDRGVAWVHRGDFMVRCRHPPGEGQAELLADAPSQVWSWDITRLRGPAKGVWFHLYLLIDIYSRSNLGWIVAPREDSVLAKDFLDEAITPTAPSHPPCTTTGAPR